MLLIIFYPLWVHPVSQFSLGWVMHSEILYLETRLKLLCPFSESSWCGCVWVRTRRKMQARATNSCSTVYCKKLWTETQDSCSSVSHFLWKEFLWFNRIKDSLYRLLWSVSVCVCLLKRLIYNASLQATYSQAPLWALTSFSAQTHHFPHFLCRLLPVSRSVCPPSQIFFFLSNSVYSIYTEFAEFGSQVFLVKICNMIKKNKIELSSFSNSTLI